MCLKDLATGLGLSITTVWRLVKKGYMKSHSSAIRPLLTKQNKIARLHWVLGKISASSLGGNLIYDAMYDVVHIDEKFFYKTRTTQKYYLLPNEPQPHRTCQSKRFISKIMFMAAVAKPRYDEDGVVLFDGKIGIFPFVYKAEAMRSSKNREKGTLEVKPIENNAKPHISPQDLDFLGVAKSDGFDMDLVFQPPNSPDLNILDLGFFRSIQTIQHKKSPKSILQLVDSVCKAYDEIDNEKLKFVWVSLHGCMNEILRVEGNNSYSIPHIGKKRVQRTELVETKVSPNKECLQKALYALENINADEEQSARSTHAVAV
uniref:Transposase n=1 Tax=Saponaria officinalis TaxID=3572 RepID=A0AAW1M2U1_SAPOF